MIERYRHPIRFYLLSILIPWGLWLYAGYLSHRPDAGQFAWLITLLGLAGLTAPMCIALYYLWKDSVLRDAAQRLWNFTVAPPIYYLISLLIMPLSIILAILVSLLFGYDAHQFHISGHASFTSYVLPVWVLFIIVPILEELAWHSYGTDVIRRKHNLLITSIIFAVFWGLWHVPLSSINGYYHSNVVAEGAIYAVNFLVSIFPFVIIMNWLYYKTGRNILVAILLHLEANVFNELFSVNPDTKIIQTGLLLVFCAVILVREPNYFFRKAIR